MPVLWQACSRCRQAGPALGWGCCWSPGPPLSVCSPNAGMSVSWSPRTGCQPEAACTELMPGRWVELGRDEKAFVSPVCVQMGTDFPDSSGGCEGRFRVLPPPPDVSPGLHPATFSTPQALLSQHLPFTRPVVAEF